LVYFLRWLVYIVVQTIVGGDDMRKQIIWIFSLLMMFMLVLTGCFKGEQADKPEDIDPPVDSESVDSENDELDDEENNEAGDREDGDGNEAEGENGVESDISSETVARQLFLVDVNGQLASQTIELPATKEAATQVLEHLVVGGPVTSMLPNGFQAVLPEGTEILGLDLKEDGTMVVDVSNEFKNYEADDELTVIQSMTYTLTQFDNVERIQLWINGHPQDVMPVDGTPIGESYSRADGINLVLSQGVDYMNSEAVTMYFPAEYNENRYYVPVTQHIGTDDDNVFEAIVESLLSGPTHSLNMTHVFNDQTLLLDEPKLEDGVLELVFNQEILKDADKAVISDEVMETLVRTLTEQNQVEAVEVKVEDIEQLTNENGETYDEPITAQNFMGAEKL